MGVRHAVQVDQAGGVALRRHPAGHGISWPGHIKDAGGIRTQFHHMIDIVPTILEATGIQAPVMVNGVAQKPIEGVSMAYTFDKANANAPSTRTTQYFEMFGNRAIYHDGWIAATTPPVPPWLMGTAKMPDVVNGYKWELYNIAEDYSENNDLAAKNARQAARDAGTLPGRGGEIQRVPAGQLGPAAHHHAAAERDRRADRFHLFGRDVRPSRRQRPQHPQQVLHHHCRGGNSRRAAGRE